MPFFLCTICRDEKKKCYYESAVIFESHNMTRHGAARKPCGVGECSAIFADIANLNRHRLAVHHLDRYGREARFYICAHVGCDYSCVRKDNFTRHVVKCRYAAPTAATAVPVPAAAAFAAPTLAPAPASVPVFVAGPVAPMVPGNSQETAIDVDDGVVRDSGHSDKGSKQSPPADSGYAAWSPGKDEEEPKGSDPVFLEYDREYGSGDDLDYLFE